MLRFRQSRTPKTQQRHRIPVAAACVLDQLEYYTTGQLAVIDVASRNERRIGAPAMIRNVDMGPDGAHLRVTTMQKPFSYIVPVSSFGGREELWAVDGRVITMLSERPLNEGIRQGGPPDPDAARTSSPR